MGDSEGRFLAVGDNSEIGRSLVQMLAGGGFSGEACTSDRQALSMLKHRTFHGVICDHTTSGMSGMGLLNEVRTSFPEVAFVMVTESGDVRHGVLAMIAGASGYLLKPLQSDAVVTGVRQALQRKRLELSLTKPRTER
jgi:DNA-binding NtrC family response regulator